MVPYSHILWASLWWGIAANAVSLAAEFVRAGARKTPGTRATNRNATGGGVGAAAGDAAQLDRIGIGI